MQRKTPVCVMYLASPQGPIAAVPSVLPNPSTHTRGLPALLAVLSPWPCPAAAVAPGTTAWLLCSYHRSVEACRTLLCSSSDMATRSPFPLPWGNNWQSFCNKNSIPYCQSLRLERIDYFPDFTHLVEFLLLEHQRNILSFSLFLLSSDLGHSPVAPAIPATAFARPPVPLPPRP